MDMLKIRTDLALEARESFEGDGGEISGVVLTKQQTQEGVRVTTVRIQNEDGSRIMKKPVGTYLTLEAETLSHGGPREREAVARVFSGYLKEMLDGVKGKKTVRSVLAVGLGNEEITADALGPQVMAGLKITRRLQERAEGRSASDTLLISSIVPGVMAQTGMETAEIIRGIVRETKPDLAIAVDALAARSITRLGTTIQLTDTGIQPGSGVGNHRGELTLESLGVPVIAIGVPTVVGAAAIVFDTMDALEEALKEGGMEFAAEEIGKMSQEERYHLIRELLEPKFGPMFVTPKDIDQTVRNVSQTLSMGINGALDRIHS